MRDEERARWTKSVADFESVDLSQREFAQERGLPLSNLRYWIYRLLKESRLLVTEAAERSDQVPEQATVGEGSRLVPVRVAASAPTARRALAERPAGDGLLQLALPSGALVRFPAGRRGHEDDPRPRGLLCAVAVGLSACVSLGRSTPSTRYELQAIFEGQPVAGPGPALVVAPRTAVPGFDGPRIVYVKRSHELPAPASRRHSTPRSRCIVPVTRGEGSLHASGQATRVARSHAAWVRMEGQSERPATRRSPQASPQAAASRARRREREVRWHAP
jgi:hypothetical protein